MTERAKVTAILPCYNHAEYLEERIQSVLSQSFPVDQIVFLDDASSDDSVSLAKLLLKDFDGQVDYCINATNSGSPFSQWNAGVSIAIHDLVWIAETDDKCSILLIEKLHSAIIGSKAVLAFAQSKFIDSNGNCIGSMLTETDKIWPGTFHKSFTIDGPSFVQNYMNALNPIPNASAVLFRRDAFITAGKANETMRYCGDWDMWIRICAAGNVCFIADELNFFRFHPNTTRASGYTPAIAAEYFVCKLKACTAIPRASKLTVLQMINGLIDLRYRQQWFSTIHALSPNQIISTKEYYMSLYDAPRLSSKAWQLLWLILRCTSLVRLSINFLHRIHRLLLHIQRIICLANHHIK